MTIGKDLTMLKENKAIIITDLVQGQIFEKAEVQGGWRVESGGGRQYKENKW